MKTEIAGTVHSTKAEPIPRHATIEEGRKTDVLVPGGVTLEIVTAGHGHVFRVLPETDDARKALLDAAKPGAKATIAITIGE